MAATIYYVASTIDGYIADADDKLAWLFQFGFEPFQEHYDRFMADIGALVMGGATYQFILDLGQQGWEYGAMPAWVFTRRELPSVPGADIHFVAGPVGAAHDAALAAAGGKNVWLIGGGNVAAQFADHGLIDELHLSIMPVVLGAGKPLLPLAGPTKPLELLRTTHFDRGAVELVYRFSKV